MRWLYRYDKLFYIFGIKQHIKLKCRCKNWVNFYTERQLLQLSSKTWKILSFVHRLKNYCSTSDSDKLDNYSRSCQTRCFALQRYKNIALSHDCFRSLFPKWNINFKWFCKVLHSPSLVSLYITELLKFKFKLIKWNLIRLPLCWGLFNTPQVCCIWDLVSTVTPFSPKLNR